MIRQLTFNLYAAMNEELGQIASTSESSLQCSERSYHAVQSTLVQLKRAILDYNFKDLEEEVLFFKEVKPMFLKELIYHKKIFYLEAGKPIGDKDAQRVYLKQAIERINLFFVTNHDLYIYYRTGKHNHDEQYFTRSPDAYELLPEYSLDFDPKFSTIHSFKFAKIQAYEQLNRYLQQALYRLDDPDALIAEPKRKHANSWTDTKAALIELAYALHSRGSVNHGKGDVKQLIADLEMVFNVQVGNFYRAFQTMRIRKKNRTAYLDTLKESLERRMDDSDLNFS